jgi:hypothetical protein
MEDYKSKFTVSSFKEDLAQYFPLIHSIMQETGEIDLEDLVHENSNEIDETQTSQTKKSNVGFEQFENWANRVEEGYLEPDTIMALKDMLDSGDLDVVGLDATTSIEALQGIGVIKDEDDDLPQALKALARTPAGKDLLKKELCL